MKIDWKKLAPYLVAVVAFFAFALIYCSPLLEGKVIQAGDVNTWRGAANEILEYKKSTGEQVWWTGRIPCSAECRLSKSAEEHPRILCAEN